MAEQQPLPDMPALPFPLVEASGSLDGHASYYGGKFHGRRTASGERYNKLALTAASNRFPLNARLAVRREDSLLALVIFQVIFRVDRDKWPVWKTVDFPLVDAAIDCIAIPGEQQGRKQGVFAVAAARTVVASVVERFADAKIKLAAIDIPEMALRNISALFAPSRRGNAHPHITQKAQHGGNVVQMRHVLQIKRVRSQQ